VITGAANLYRIENKNVSSFAVNDRVIATPVPCVANLSLDTITATPVSTATTLTAASGLVGATRLYNMGQSPTVNAYAIRNGNLTQCDF